MRPQITLVDGEKTNGLGMVLKDLINRNLRKEKLYNKSKKLNCDMIIKLIDMNVAVTLTFDRGKISIKNGEKPGSKLFIGSDFTTLANLCSGKVSPIKAKLKKKLITRGSLFTLFKIQQLMKA